MKKAIKLLPEYEPVSDLWDRIELLLDAKIIEERNAAEHKADDIQKPSITD